MSSGAQKIYVSLTTISARLGTLGKVLNSILDQSPPADGVFLVVSEEGRFLDAGIAMYAIPQDVKTLVDTGRVNLVFHENTGPYRKLVPMLERFHGEDCLIVTADDDTIYPDGWLRHLVEAFHAHQCVIAYRGRAMRVVDGRFDRYSRWSKLPTWRDNFGEIAPEYHGLFTLATGVFGVAYSPRFFPDLDLLRRLMDIAPLQDDLGFKAAALVHEIPTHVLVELDGDDPESSFEEINGGGQLFDTNVDRNDAVWAQIFALISAEYGFDIGKYISRPSVTPTALEARWADRVLAFWFDELSAADRAGKQPVIDEQIRHRFGDLYLSLRDAAASMSFDDPETALAAIVVFDQFARRIFRRDSRKFATDPLALAIARTAMERGFDRQVDAPRRLFFYMPFSHSEDMADQDVAVALMGELGPGPALSAETNRSIVARFGRFPHRNKHLGRPNTDLEMSEWFSMQD